MKAFEIFFAFVIFASVSGSFLLIKIFPSLILFFVLLIGALLICAVVWKKTIGNNYTELVLWCAGIAGSIGIFIFLDVPALEDGALIIFGLTAVLFWIFYMHTAGNPEEYLKRQQMAWLEWASIYVVFLASSLGFAFFTFFRFPVFLNALLLSVILTFLFYINTLPRLKDSDANRQKMFWTNVAFFVMVFELLWVMHFLPFGFFVSGLVSGAIFTLWTVLVKNKIFGKLASSKERTLIIGAMAVLVLAFLLARWL